MNARSNRRRMLWLASVLSLGSMAPAQERGAGNIGSNGLEPRVELESRAGGATLAIHVADAATGAGPGAIHLMVAFSPGALPLDRIGLPGVVLGLDLGQIFVLGPFPTTPAGDLDLLVPVDPLWHGLPVHVQVFYIDRSVTPNLLVFSDSDSIIVGSPSAPVVIAMDGASAGTIDLARVHVDGSPGIALPDMAGLVLRDLVLTALREDRRFRHDRPAPITIGGRAAVRLPDGSSLLQYTKPLSSVQGLAHVTPAGRVRILLEDSFIEPFLAASVHGPYVGFLSGIGAGRRLWIYRTDGRNDVGLASPLRNVTPPSVSLIEEDSLIFGRSVLLAMPNTGGPILQPVDGSPRVPVSLPPSGGATPVVFDNEIAVSGDGRRFAFGAGSTRRMKDVYILEENGTGINVTNAPADYAEVGYSNPNRRVEMVLDHDGTKIAYVIESTPEPETFIVTVPTLSAVHLTTTTAFLDSIDVGSVGDLPRIDGAMILAGLNAQSLDVYYSPTCRPEDVVNLTGTGSTQPPFGTGSQLTILDLGTLSNDPQYLVQAFHAGLQSVQLLALDAIQETSRVVADSYPEIGLALRSSSRIAAADGNQVILADPTDVTAGFRTALALQPGDSVHALRVNPLDDSLAVLAGASANALHLWTVRPGTPATTRRTTVAADLEDVRSGFANESFFFITLGSGLSSFTPSGGVQNLGWSGARFFVQHP